ncbi:type VI secretion system contractile sheath small subunit [Aliivibrio sp. S4TY2]|uniref:Type VI secretion system contractile sheath small subunit n=1 Tax=Aliivibrio finisterrensis TaxID=511998 RepID=A0A4Q5KPE2_9GAMM|nr:MULTISPECIES: type VI secretion system contractile sheath small subunit [Aliivibrio]MDD9157500.1 type VI secretion system contractile sheath small subunit [Aliivibrio sp. S4TY2]MDD9161306.1 type VI secretion system contractile sheath small subunit [Aliivibrio sp. S4TY1]MDD9165336.1 type VI secretion system contractile sheath small subunit [Aliivibrio sp. S4MY2]MDD9169409.1 type VI secretion system contractile sheath small subunit [Aliivibrio sp. S4MY4]MDD9173539.1 type VI secretion system c
MSKDGSVAPKERVNVTFKPATGDATEELELPLKMMVLGDFTQQEDERKLEDRKPFSVDKNNFNDVIEKQNLNIQFGVKNQLQEGEEGSDEIPVNLSFKHINDFDPASIVEQVPELKGLMDLREALVSLKGPLGNVPAFRKAIEDALVDETAREKLLNELGLATEKE